MKMSRAAKEAANEKLSTTCSQRLVPRLARFFGDDSIYGKQKVRQWLRTGGYKGPGWKDENRAIEALTAVGKDMALFERTKPEKAQSGFAKAAKAFSPRPITVVAVAPENNPVTKLKNVTILLKQGQRMILQGIREGRIQEIDEVSAQLLAAWNEARR
jgi:hypothetical protein